MIIAGYVVHTRQLSTTMHVVTIDRGRRHDDRHVAGVIWHLDDWSGQTDGDHEIVTDTDRDTVIRRVVDRYLEQTNDSNLGDHEWQ